MAGVCPTVLASSKEEFTAQLQRVSFAPRIQLDFMDGEFAPTTSIELKDAWLPQDSKADLHLMYQRPMEYLPVLLALEPNMVIIHAEANVDHLHMASELHKAHILAGLCVLPETPIGRVEQMLSGFDHLLIFGGHLGHFGGQADLNQLSKAWEAKERHPDLEIGWDGGVNADNAKQLAGGGVDVLNVVALSKKPTTRNLLTTNLSAF